MAVNIKINSESSFDISKDGNMVENVETVKVGNKITTKENIEEVGKTLTGFDALYMFEKKPTNKSKK